MDTDAAGSAEVPPPPLPFRFSHLLLPLLLPSLLPLHLCCSALPHSLPRPPAASRNVPQPPAASRSLPERTPRRPSSARLPGWRCGGCVVQCAAGCGALSLRSRSRAAPDPAARLQVMAIEPTEAAGSEEVAAGSGVRAASCAASCASLLFSLCTSAAQPSPTASRNPPERPATSRNVPQPPGTSRIPQRRSCDAQKPSPWSPSQASAPCAPANTHSLVRTGHKPLRRAIACTSTRRAAPAGRESMCK